MSTSGNTRTTLISPFQYFADPTRGRPVFNGFIYIGRVNGDPTNPDDQIPIQVICECGGTPVNVTQPVRTGPGGLPIYNGSPAQIVVCRSNYSITLQDKDRVQVYHSPEVRAGATVNQPITHVTLADAIADDNSRRQSVKLLERGGVEFRRAVNQAEYNSFPASARFTDAVGILWVVNYIYVILASWLGITGNGNEQMPVNDLLKIQGYLDFQNMEVTVNTLDFSSNTTIVNGNFILSDAHTSTNDLPNCTGNNFVRGTNTEINYPTTMIENVKFENCTFRYQNLLPVTRYMFSFYNANDFMFKKCAFSNINGFGLRFIGNTNNVNVKDPNIIPLANLYCENINIIDCEFNDAFVVINNLVVPLGYATHFVGSRNILLSNNNFNNCLRNVDIDFLNYNANVVDNYIVITDPRISSNVENIPDLFGIFFGQATQIGYISGNSVINIPRRSIYLESSSSIKVIGNNVENIESYPTSQSCVVAATTLRGNPLANMENIISENSFKGAYAPVRLGSPITPLSCSVIFTDNIIEQNTSSTVLSITSFNLFDSIISNNILNGVGGLGLSTAIRSKVHDNFIKSMDFSLRFDGGSYTDTSIYNNTLNSSTQAVFTNNTLTPIVVSDGHIITTSSVLRSDGTNNGISILGYRLNNGLDVFIHRETVTIPSNGSVTLNVTGISIRSNDLLSGHNLNVNLSLTVSYLSNTTAQIKVNNTGNGITNSPQVFTILVIRNTFS